MRFLVLSLALIAVPAAAGPVRRAAPGDQARCARPGAQHAARLAAPARVRPLGEMLPGRQELAVYREVAGCPTPAVVRYPVGSPARR